MKIALSFMFRFTLLVILVLFNGCVEETSFDTEAYTEALVIEAAISNASTQHTVTLSRTYTFIGENTNPETGASVSVESNGETFLFLESADGIYISQNAFAAQAGKEYVLTIETSDGELYQSTPQVLTAPQPIVQYYAERSSSTEGDPVLSFFVESGVTTNDPTYFRYEFEETYKVIAPLYSDQKLVILNALYPFCDVALVDKQEENRVCYASRKSEEVFIASSEGLATSVLPRLTIRTVATDDYIIAHRYSLLVKQYAITREAHSFYDNLKRFQENPSVFSQVQPGFVQGNIYTNNAPVAVGYFEVSNLTSQRVYTNFVEFFPDVTVPSQVFDCDIDAPVHYLDLAIPPLPDCGALIPEFLAGETHQFYRANIDQQFYTENGAYFPLDGPYDLVPIACGDCTLFGETTVPDFWEE